MAHKAKTCFIFLNKTFLGHPVFTSQEDGTPKSNSLKEEIQEWLLWRDVDHIGTVKQLKERVKVELAKDPCFEIDRILWERGRSADG